MMTSRENDLWTFSACTFCFPNTDHVIILRRLGPLFCSLKRVHVGIFMHRYAKGH